MREDPVTAEKNEKRKKNRLKSAKRPLTAKKKKQDMMKGDIVSLVETMATEKTAQKKNSGKQNFPKAKGIINA